MWSTATTWSLLDQPSHTVWYPPSSVTEYTDDTTKDDTVLDGRTGSAVNDDVTIWWVLLSVSEEDFDRYYFMKRGCLVKMNILSKENGYNVHVILKNSY